ncbi:MAG: 3-hydroxyacyl-ACP dehydratase [Deltaproteobacteria bacterium]|nr:3-hydroxyacyl-ACP dehydratase [Deltaproteobacteria bacterium]TLN02593.1 MAG: 3-hydroxyacyl-ACP dehydratase [bacterium]
MPAPSGIVAVTLDQLIIVAHFDVSGVFIKLAGIDIGSRSIEFVLLDSEGYEVVERFQTETSIDLSSQLSLIKERYSWDHLISTGYGRQLSQKVLGGEVITEIKAYATSAHHFHPEIETVIDLGGQDTKALLINQKNGQLLKFEMNDKCSAGTGKFFEMMAGSLGLSLNELVAAALQGNNSIEINSTCTVFAESEVISLLTAGISLEDIARAIHEALLKKLVALLSKVTRPDATAILFVGGGAKNNALVQFLSAAISKQVLVPEYPDFYGAYGAALTANILHQENL